MFNLSVQKKYSRPALFIQIWLSKAYHTLYDSLLQWVNGKGIWNSHFLKCRFRNFWTTFIVIWQTYCVLTWKPKSFLQQQLLLDPSEGRFSKKVVFYATMAALCVMGWRPQDVYKEIILFRVPSRCDETAELFSRLVFGDVE